MRYSQEELTQVEELASIFMTIKDIAIILDVPAHVLRDEIRDSSSDVSRAYQKGKTLAKMEMRRQEMALAKIGSPLALQNTHQNLLDMDDDE